MSEHHASVQWARTSHDFAYDNYNRAHEMRFKNGLVVLAASAAPQFLGDAERMDPEEAYVASLASCHMLSFLAICARKRLIVESYEDAAIGFLEKGSSGKFSVTRVTLKPRARFATGTAMDAESLAKIHHQSHEECFIANSVKTHITVEPVGCEH